MRGNAQAQTPTQTEQPMPEATITFEDDESTGESIVMVELPNATNPPSAPSIPEPIRSDSPRDNPRSTLQLRVGKSASVSESIPGDSLSPQGDQTAKRIQFTPLKDVPLTPKNGDSKDKPLEDSSCSCWKIVSNCFENAAKQCRNKFFKPVENNNTAAQLDDVLTQTLRI